MEREQIDREERRDVNAEREGAVDAERGRRNMGGRSGAIA